MPSATTLIALAPLLAPGPDSWVQPTRTTRTSPDGRWSVTVTPGKCTACGPELQAEHTGPHATAVATAPDGTARTFELIHPAMPVGLHLTDSGDLYCFDHWGRMGYGRCLVRYDARGTLAWARTLDQLLSADRRAEIHPTISSRNWLRHPLRVVDEEGGFAVSLFNSDQLHVDRTSGAPTYEEVDEFGDDAQGWLLKALARERSGDLDGAAARLHRAVDLDLALVRSYASISQAHHRAGRDAKAIALIEGALERTRAARWTDEAGLDPRLSLRNDLASAYLNAGLPARAQVILRELVAVAPELEAPEAALIGLLFRGGHDDEADALVERGYERRLRAGQQHPSAVLSAAYLCQNAGELERAASWYRRGIAAGAWSENLGLAFVHLLDGQLNQLDEAAEVLARVVDDMHAGHRAERDAARREWWDRRLKDFEGRLKDLRRRARGG